MSRYELLLVEDSPSDAELVGFELDGLDGFAPGDVHLECVYTRAEFEQRLRGPAPTAVLCDSQLPEMYCDEALSLVRTYWPATPFILCSGTLYGDARLQAVMAQADAVIDKNHLEDLNPALLKLPGFKRV